MTKIYEALEKASQGQGNAGNDPAVSVVRSAAPKAIDRTMQGLCQHIESLVDTSRGKIVQFAGAQPGDDSSRLLSQFALTASGPMFRNVLLAVGGPFSRAKDAFSVKTLPTWEEVVEGEKSLDEVLHPVDENLTLTQIALSEGNLPRLLRNPALPAFLEELRERFDLILIDAPPLGRTAEAALLSAVADGVVLVVEARRTRWQVVKNAMDQVEMQKGNVLGVILNKRRFYIPGFIYRRL